MGGERRDSDLEHTGQRSLHRKPEDQRGSPRVKLHMPVQIGLRGGQVVCARIYNMSPDGVQVRCETSAALLINPSGRAVEPGGGPLVQVAMRLNTGVNVSTFAVRARVSYVLPESAEEVIIGLSFEALNQHQRDAIEAALSASLIPRGS